MTVYIQWQVSQGGQYTTAEISLENKQIISVDSVSYQCEFSKLEISKSGRSMKAVGTSLVSTIN